MTRPDQEPVMLRILVVEDEALIAEEITDRLGRLGHRVVGVAETAKGAVEIAERERPDLVLMDIRLKGEADGIAAAAELRRRLNIPAVYLTAHSDRSTVERAKETLPQGFLLKPFHERELAVAVELAVHRYRLELQQEASSLRYAATLTSLGDGVIATDLHGQITFLNAVASALTGWTASDSAGMPIEDVFSLVREADRRPVESPIYRALRDGAVVELLEPTLLIDRRGEAVPIDDSAAPIRVQDGRVLGAVVVFRDLRQRRLAADSLERAAGDLARTRSLEAVGRLAGGIAHDFNSLLTVIGGYSEMLLDEGLNARADAMVREIQSATRRATELTAQLLAFGGGQLLRPISIDLNVFVLDSLPLLRRLMGEGVVVSSELAVGALPTFVDPKQLELVLTHLASNARGAMPEGGRLVFATRKVELGGALAPVRPEFRPGAYVMLAVTDSGCGMESEVVANLFQPFFSTREVGEGRGLSLAAAYGIARQSGGHLEVESAVGRGTMFRLYLPAEGPAPLET